VIPVKHAVYGAILATALAGGAHAATLPDSFIDFEVFPDLSTPVEGNVPAAFDPLRYEFPLGGGTNAVTFSSQGPLGFAEVGGDTAFGFNSVFGNDTPNPADAFGSFFLTSELQPVSTLLITYDDPIGALNFDLGDIDSGQNPGSVEIFTIQFRDAADNVLATRQVRGDQTFQGQATGDGSVVNVSYTSGSNNIKSVFITGGTEGNVRRVGIAFDNFDPDSASEPPNVIPVPPTLPLIAAGIGALALLRRRKTAA
jgi:hypothetical protein